MIEYKTLRQQLRKKLSSILSSEDYKNSDELRDFISDEVNLHLLGEYIPVQQRRQLIDDLYNALRGLDILQELMEDPSISEIMVNGSDSIFIERDGKISKTKLSFDNSNHLLDIITNYFSHANKPLNLSQPIADLRLEDGSRANAVLAPIASNGPILTIRKFTSIKPTADALISSKFLSYKTLELLKQAVIDKKSIFICGGTGSGKTTLLNILSNYIPKDERIITIEDSAELQLQNVANLVRLECRAAASDIKAIEISDLIKTSLRMRPDRIIVGEIRGAEAWDMLTAMNSGHPGTLCTGHANSCADMLRRLANILLGSHNIPYQSLMDNLHSAINYLVHISRTSSGHRYIDELCEIKYNGFNDYSLVPLPLD